MNVDVFLYFFLRRWMFFFLIAMIVYRRFFSTPHLGSGILPVIFGVGIGHWIDGKPFGRKMHHFKNLNRVLM